VQTEVADGVDIRRDILDPMEFALARIPDRPKPMDQALFAHRHEFRRGIFLRDARQRAVFRMRLPRLSG
jgi:acyl CoA:acetate/3-ketoacid CoA transferase